MVRQQHSWQDITLLEKRGLIETVIGQLKEVYQIEHSRYRSVTGLFANVLSALIAYSLKENKPKAHMA